MAFKLLVSTLLAIILCLPVQARDQSSLGDLTVLASRVPDWVHASGYQPNTSGWTTTLVNTAEPTIDCADNATDDTPELNTVIAAAAANTILQFAAGCVYNVTTAISITKSNLILQGAGMDSTFIKKAAANNSNVIVFSGTAAGAGADNWTARYTKGETILTLSSAVGFIVNDYVLMRAGYPAGTLGQTGARPGYYHFVAQIDAVNGNDITIDLPLPQTFDTVNQRVVELTPRVNVGIKNMTIVKDTPTVAMHFVPLVILNVVANAEVSGVKFDGIWSSSLNLTGSTRVWVHSNVFTNQNRTDPFQKGHLKNGTQNATNTFENNALLDTDVMMEIENGTTHSIIAYNYQHDDAGTCERSIHLHNDFSSANLIEGNDFECRLEFDEDNGGSGPYNTAYRNRVRSGEIDWEGQQGWISLFGITAGANDHWSWNILANHSRRLWNGGAIGFDAHAITMHAERNIMHDPVSTTDCILAQNGGTTSADCADNGAEPNTADTTWTNNLNATVAPGSWSTFNFPDSLYLTGAPSWWCQESGTFPNIGAPSDNSAGTYSRLPAQIMAEGGICSTYVAEGGPAPCP